MANLAESRVRGKKDGFTMIEVVISSAVLVVVFVALLGSISTSRRISSITENRLACMHIARKILEPYSTFAFDSADFAVGTKQLPDNRGTVVITADSANRNKEVTVTINWVEPTRMTQSVSVTSSFSRSLHR